MSAMFPFAPWLAGTNQNSIPANDNALRSEVLAKAAEGVADSEPVSPTEREMWIVGTTWGGFATDSAVIYIDGTWYEFEAFEGWAKVIDGTLSIYDGSAWQAQSSGSAQASVRQEAASYTPDVGDQVVEMNVGSANNFTIPPNSTSAFPVGWFLEVWQMGAGQTTIVAGSGVTILKHADLSLNLKGQNSGCSLRKVATDTWRLVGDLEPV